MPDGLSIEMSTTKPDSEKNIAEIIADAATKVLKFSDRVVYDRINKMDSQGEITLSFPITSSSGRSAEFVGTTHNHDLEKEGIEKQKEYLVDSFKKYIDNQRKNGGKPMLMIEGGKITEYSSYEEAMKVPGEFAVLVWMAQEESVPVYSPDTTPEDTTQIMKNENYPIETIAFLECFKTMHVKVNEKMANNEPVEFSEQEIANLLLGVIERTEWQDLYPQAQKLKDGVETFGMNDKSFREQIGSFIETVLNKLNKTFQTSTKAVVGGEGFPMFQINGKDEQGYDTFTTLYKPKEHFQPLLRPDTFADDNLKTPMNELSKNIGDLRELVVFQRIATKIKDGYDPFIVFGNSHAIKQAPAIRYLYSKL